MSVKDMQKFMSAASMSEKEIQEFLSIPRLARMATIQNGKPHLVPVWYFYDGTNIIVSTPKGTKKTKNLQSNPNVSIIIDIVDGRVEDLSYATKAKAVIIEGIAELHDDIDSSFARKSLQNPHCLKLIDYSGFTLLRRCFIFFCHTWTPAFSPFVPT